MDYAQTTHFLSVRESRYQYIGFPSSFPLRFSLHFSSEALLGQLLSALRWFWQSPHKALFLNGLVKDIGVRTSPKLWLLLTLEDVFCALKWLFVVCLSALCCCSLAGWCSCGYSSLWPSLRWRFRCCFCDCRCRFPMLLFWLLVVMSYNAAIYFCVLFSPHPKCGVPAFLQYLQSFPFSSSPPFSSRITCKSTYFKSNDS